MMNAGERNHKIKIERNNADGGTAAENTFGEAVDNWTLFATEWAGMIWGKGIERRQAGRENASAPATFFVLTNSKTRTVTPADRLRYDSAIWDISSAVPRGLDQIEITAARAA